MAGEKSLANLFDILVLLEQRATDKDQHIPGYIAAARNQTTQCFGMKKAPALRAFEDSLMRGKRRSHAQHILFSRFLHIEFVAAQTGIALRSKPYRRHLSKQTLRASLLVKSLQALVQCRQSCRTGV